MNNKSLLFMILVFLLMVSFPVSQGFAGIGDGLTEKEKRRLFGETRKIFESLKEIIPDLKKVNIRLKELETKDVENLKQTHAELISQVEMIQKLLPNLRGMVEQSQIDMAQKISGLNSNLNQSITNLENELQQQEKVREQFHGNLLADIGQLQQGIKNDMKAFANLNQQSFESFSKANSEAFQKIVKNVSQQNQKMAEAHQDLINVLQGELVPAIQSSLKQGLASMETSVNQGLVTLGTKNDTMTQILKKNLKGLQGINQKMVLLGDNLEKTNTNVKTVGGGINQLQGSLDKKMESLIQGQADLAAKTERISRIAEILEGLKSQGNNVGISLNTLHASVARLQEITGHAEEALSKQNDITVKTVETFSNQLGEKLDQSLLKADEGTASDKLNQEKMDKMIGIMETAMVNGSLDEKINQTVEKIEEGQAGVNLVNEKLTKLIEILRTIVKNQSELEQMKKAQTSIKESLADLKRKANVNISRNDDIKKAVKKIRKALPGPAAKKLP